MIPSGKGVLHFSPLPICFCTLCASPFPVGVGARHPPAWGSLQRGVRKSLPRRGAAGTDSIPGRRCPWQRETGSPSLPCPVVSIPGQVWPVRCSQLAWCPAACGQGCGWQLRCSCEGLAHPTFSVREEKRWRPTTALTQGINPRWKNSAREPRTAQMPLGG